MTKLYVRVAPKSGAESFFRCGEQFGKDWKEVEVDTATAERLQDEQMLEVTNKKPAKTEPAPAEPATTEPATTEPAPVEPAAAGKKAAK